MKIQSISKSMKLAILGIGFSLLTNTVKSQTFRIQEHSVNPNCGGTYQVFRNSSPRTPAIAYNYFTAPPTVNKTMPQPAPPSLGNCYDSIPNFITFTNVSNCRPMSFTIPINGIVTLISCNCDGSGYINRNFSSTLQLDPLNYCTYLLDIYY